MEVVKTRTWQTISLEKSKSCQIITDKFFLIKKSFQQNELSFEWKWSKLLARTWQTISLEKRKSCHIITDALCSLFYVLFINTVYCG
jgi:hypothetical protein